LSEKVDGLPDTNIENIIIHNKTNGRSHSPTHAYRRWLDFLLQFYELYQIAAGNSSFSLFNFRKFQFGRNHSVFAENDTSYALLSQDKAAWMVFGKRVLAYWGVISFYNTRLLEMKRHAVALIKNLKGAYGI